MACRDRLNLTTLNVTKCGIGKKGLKKMLQLPPNLPSLRIFEFDTD